MDEYTCANQVCIQASYECDFEDDCGDYSDEINCVCNTDREFACASGGCIPNSWVCDDREDCPDSSDEAAEFCTVEECTEGQLMCQDGVTCYNATGRCDGVQDCPSYDDDVFCDECAENAHHCPDDFVSVCIPISARYILKHLLDYSNNNNNNVFLYSAMVFIVNDAHMRCYYYCYMYLEYTLQQNK